MNKQLLQTVQEENLKEEETRKFLEDSFRNGEIKTTGTDLDKIMPRFFGLGSNEFTKDE